MALSGVQFAYSYREEHAYPQMNYVSCNCLVCCKGICSIKLRNLFDNLFPCKIKVLLINLRNNSLRTYFFYKLINFSYRFFINYVFCTNSSVFQVIISALRRRLIATVLAECDQIKHPQFGRAIHSFNKLDKVCSSVKS